MVEFFLSLLLLELCFMAFVALLTFAMFVLWFGALFDCLGSRHPDKTVWALVIFVTGPVGGAIWLLYAKKQIVAASSALTPRPALPPRTRQISPTAKRQPLIHWQGVVISMASVVFGMCLCLVILIVAANWNNPALR